MLSEILGSAAPEDIEKATPDEFFDLADNVADYKPSKFHERLQMHRDLMDELEHENILPAPTTKVQKFAPQGKVNYKLGGYKIPPYIYRMLEKVELNGHMEDEHEPLSDENYKKRFQTLLWLEEACQIVEMHRYDMRDVLFAREENSSRFKLEVPGLAEGRPSLMPGDRIIARSELRSSLYEGYIADVLETSIILCLHESILDLEGIRFDVTFQVNRSPFRRCHQAVSTYRHTQKVLFPQPCSAKPPKIKLPETKLQDLRCFNDRLNQYQREAVYHVLLARSRPAPYIIYGPCGTGKTITMIECILQVYARQPDAKILVCANSNACVDLLAERLKQVDLIPVHKMCRVSAFHRYKRGDVPEEIEDITKINENISYGEYAGYRVIITTCVQAGTLFEFIDRFEYLFIDEAGHASEPEALIPFGLLKPEGCVILAGDPMQLGPVCLSRTAARIGLGESLLERLSKIGPYTRRPTGIRIGYDNDYVSKLMISYRSDPRVMALNNELFYDGDLKFENKTPEKWMTGLGVNSPIVFHPVLGKDRREHSNPSWYNAHEIIPCLAYVLRLYNLGLRPDQLGVITPYSCQMAKLEQTFFKNNLAPCKIGSMEQFQGDEREIIIISTVRAKPKYLETDKRFNLGFISNPKRFNVGISRAKWMVIVVGDPRVLLGDPLWSQLIARAHVVKTAQAE